MIFVYFLVVRAIALDNDQNNYADWIFSTLLHTAHRKYRKIKAFVMRGRRFKSPQRLQ